MPSKMVEKLMDLFRGHGSASGTHGTPEKDPDSLKWSIKKTARTLREPPTLELWEQHVAGKRPLGVIPIREDNSCSWGSIDFDQYNVELPELVRRVEAAKLPLVPCRSKSGGLHLFLFLTEPATALEVQSALRDMAASLGLADSEIFPKQTELLTDRGDAGNWIVMPYFGSTYGNKLKTQVGIKRTGAEMTISEFVRVAEERRTPIAKLTELIDKRKTLPGGKGKGSKGNGALGRGDFSDGPPCLQHLCTAGIPLGDGRKRTLFMMAIYHKRGGSDNWKTLVEESNSRYFSPPLPAEEVAGVVRSVSKKDYEYTCKAEPMRSHCNSGLCRTRRFGVGQEGDYPIISGMEKLETDPPLWFLTVGNARLEVTTEELQVYFKFHRVCMERLGQCFLLMKQNDWLAMVSEAMRNATPIPATPDMGVSGTFHEHLENFLTNRTRGERKEDLLSGRPWEDTEEHRHYFTLKALQSYLVREGFKEFSRAKITTRIKDNYKGGHKQWNFGNKRGISTWYVPSDAVEAPPKVAPPPLRKEEI